jgi:uncharacterized membrane protein
MTRSRNSRRERSGAAVLEFALIAAVFIPLSLAALEAGLLLWTQGALQSTASLAARCAAIGSSNCPNVPQFVVTTAGKWVFSGIITTANVTPAPAIVCLSHANYMKVTITCPYWAGGLLPSPFDHTTLTAVAYFPVAGAAC